MRSFAAIILVASSLIAPAAASAAAAANSSHPARVSTGVVSPTVLNLENVSISPRALSTVTTPNPAVVVALKVDEKGYARDAHVVESVSPQVDAQVLRVVNDFRFRPATLDQQPIAVDMELTVHVQR
jgi:TonB family protein